MVPKLVTLSVIRALALVMLTVPTPTAAALPFSSPELRVPAILTVPVFATGCRASSVPLILSVAVLLTLVALVSVLVLLTVTVPALDRDPTFRALLVCNEPVLVSAPSTAPPNSAEELLVRLPVIVPMPCRWPPLTRFPSSTAPESRVVPAFMLTVPFSALFTSAISRPPYRFSMPPLVTAVLTSSVLSSTTVTVAP